MAETGHTDADFNIVVVKGLITHFIFLHLDRGDSLDHQFEQVLLPLVIPDTLSLLLGC